MQLVPEWRRILRRAWSVRLLAIAGALSAAEVALPAIDGLVELPRGLLPAVSGLVTAGAFIARLVAQRSLHDD